MQFPRRLLLTFFLIFSPIILATSSPVHEYTLKNGLKLFVKEDHRSPVVISQIWYKVGSSYEPNGITGISHALEHMMFRGTKQHGPGEIEKIISENGGQLNAMTSFDFTQYYELMRNDRLSIALKLEADRMRGLLLRPQDFTKEIQVVMEERRMRTDDSPIMKTYERFNAAAEVNNPYHHLPIGWPSDLKNMTVQDLQHWYKTWYAPNNAIIVIVGDVRADDVLAMVKKYFDPLQPEKVPLLKPQKEITPLGERHVTVHAPAKLPWLVLGYNVPVLNTADHAWQAYALTVAAAILDGADSARLPQDLVRGKQIATDTNVNYDPFMRTDSLFTLSATPSAQHTVKELKSALLAEVKKLQTTPVTQDELRRIKTQVIANKIYTRDSITAQATEIGALESIGRSWRDSENYVVNIQAITPEQVQAVAKEFLTTNRLTVGQLVPLAIPDHAAPNKPQDKPHHAQ